MKTIYSIFLFLISFTVSSQITEFDREEAKTAIENQIESLGLNDYQKTKFKEINQKYQQKLFDLKNSEIFSYDDLVKFGNTLPGNLRFKIFKVHKRAIINYQNIIDKTLDRDVKEDYRLSTSWPYSSFEFVNRAEVKIGLEYDKTFGVKKGFHLDEQGNVIKDS